MNILILFTIVFVLAFTLFKAKIFKLTGVHVVVLILLFGIKFGGGVMINKYYFDRYENQEHSDIYKYFDDGHELFKIALEQPTIYFKIMSGLYENDKSTFEFIDRLSNWKAQTSNYKKSMNYQDANFFNSHRTMARINSLFCFLSRGYLPTQTLLFSFLSFTGIILIYLTFLHKSKFPSWIVLSILSCAPSLLIWTSSVQKESVMIFGTGMLVYGLFQARKNYFLIAIAVVSLMFVSYYTLLLLLLAYGASLVYKKGIKLLMLTTTVGITVLLILFSFIKLNPLNPLSSRFNLQNKIGKGGYYLESIQKGNIVYFEHEDFEQIKSKLVSKKRNDLIHFNLSSDLLVFDFKKGIQSKTRRLLNTDKGWYYQKLHFVPANSYVHHDMLKPELKSFANHFFNAVKNTILIPFYEWDKKTLPFYLESIIFYLAALMLVFRKIKKGEKIMSVNSIFLLIFATLSFLLIGYSTPIIGNIVRHKSLAMLFIMVLVLKENVPKKAKKIL